MVPSRLATRGASVRRRDGGADPLRRARLSISSELRVTRGWKGISRIWSRA